MSKINILVSLGFLLFFSLAASAFSSDNQENSELQYLNDNLLLIWIAVATILVFFMQAGFALIESGMSRTKNSINVMMKNYVDVCFVSIAFWAIGYGFLWGQNSTGFIGETGFLGSGIQTSSNAYLTILFQTVFAATAVTICSGAMAERVKYNSYLISSVLITVFVYSIFASWVWNENGWLNEIGFIDFSGATVVHSVGAWCALAGIMITGPRLGRFDPHTNAVRPIRGHNLSLVALGGFILWFGWFGFNGGGINSFNDNLGLILLNTHLSGAGGAIGMAFISFVMRRPILLTSAVNGTLGGLVGMTAGCHIIDPQFAFLVGFISGIVVYFSQKLLLKFKLDDVVGAISVHGFAGVWGTLAAGFFISGDLFNFQQFSTQFLGIIIAFFWAFPISFVIFLVIDLTIGVRSPTLHEQRGLDFTEHNEIGYPEFHSDSTYKPDNVNNDNGRQQNSHSF